MEVELDSKALVDAIKTSATLMGAEVDVLLTAIDKGFLRIEAGVASSHVYHTLPASVKESGRVVIPIQRLIGLPLNDSITITANDRELSFKSGSFSGTLKAGASVDEIISNRPIDKFKASVTIPAEVLKSALMKNTLRSSLPGSQIGVRIQVGEDLTVSTTDQYRASIYKDDLAIKQEEFNVLMQPEFLQGALGKVMSPEIRLGVHRGVLHIATDVMDVYHPSIQQDSEDIEDWIDNGIDYKKRECRITVSCDQFSKKIREVSSVQMGSLDYDTHFDLLIKRQKAYLRCSSDHGSAKSSLALFRSDATKTLSKLSSRYTLEMLNMIRAGDADISIWDDFILFEGNEGRFRGIIPTVAS